MKKTMKAALLLALGACLAACTGSSDAKSQTASSDAADASNQESTVSVNQDDLDDPIYTALQYLDKTGFSKDGLIDQMVHDGYDRYRAEDAIDSIDPDWNEQAKKVANTYLLAQDYTEEELAKELKNAGFTDEQAAAGAKAAKEEKK